MKNVMEFRELIAQCKMTQIQLFDQGWINQLSDEEHKELEEKSKKLTEELVKMYMREEEVKEPIKFRIKIGEPVQIKQGDKILTEMSEKDVETLIATLCRYYFDTTGKENIVLETGGKMTGLITNLKK